MRIIADLHLHSQYSRATSPKMNIRDLSEAAKVKGVNLLGTGDFTHPGHLSDLKRDLTEEKDGFFFYNNAHFVPSAEVSNIFSWEGKVRKVHNVILAPSFEIVGQINDGLRKWGRLDYDGRPIFGKSCTELMDLCMGISKEILVIPAHIWTPWFSIFGSNSGFDRVEDCFQEHTKNIHALETGLSSDPAMNWRLSALDRFSLVSNSDSHSPYPWRFGREANVFEMEPKYSELFSALKEKDPKRFLYTIEVNPSYGKYHYDGHRACGVSLSPEEARKHNSICPVCRKPLTIGVLHRVEELADRPEGFVPKNAIPFKSVIPLAEVIAGVLGVQVASRAVMREHDALISSLGTELSILLDAPRESLEKVTSEKIAAAIILNREGKIKVKPGYDGEYGVPLFNKEQQQMTSRRQKTLSDY